MQQALSGILGRRFARAHHPIDFHLGVPLTAGRVGAQGIGQVRAAIDLIDIQGLEFGDAAGLDLFQLIRRQFVVGLRQLLTGFRIAQVVSQDLADQIFARHPQALHAGLVQVADVLGLDALARLEQHAIPDHDVETGGFALQTLRHQIQVELIVLDPDRVGVEEETENPLIDANGVGIVRIGLVEQRPQQDGDRQLAATVDACVHDVLDVEFEIQPGAAVGDDTRRKQQLAGGVRLALVVIEEHAGRAVQLRDDHPFGAIDDEGAVIGHQRQFAHVDFVFLDVLDLMGTGLGVLVHQHQPQPHSQRRGVSQSAQLAFADVEHRFAQPIADILQPRVARIADDGEYRAKSGVQSRHLAFSWRHLGLQELAVRIQLDRQQVGHFENAGAFAEVFTDTSLFSKSVGHRDSSHGSTSQGREPPNSIASLGSLFREPKRRFSLTGSKRKQAGSPKPPAVPVRVRPSQKMLRNEIPSKGSSAAFT